MGKWNVKKPLSSSLEIAIRRVMRLDKLLSNMGLGTRSEVRKFITYGNVKVNEKVIKKIGFQIKEKHRYSIA